MSGVRKAVKLQKGRVVKDVIRNSVHRLVQFMTRIYFRKIEVRGAANLPGETAILAGNHPSGLLDPMVLMTAFPDLRLASVAKHSLFETPLVSLFLEAMETVPVAQQYDVGLPAHKQPTAQERARMNAQMFTTVQERLTSGVNIAIFPEGTCHSTPEIKELKLGTARIALEVAAAGGPRIPIVPVGLSYSHVSGSQFRGSVLVDIGRPVQVTDELLELYTSGNKDSMSAAEHAITNRIERHLRYVTINVPDWTDQLLDLCIRNGWATPQYSTVSSKPVLGTRLKGEPLLGKDRDATSSGTEVASSAAPGGSNNEDVDQDKRRRLQRVTVTVQGRTFQSTTVLESKSDRRRRRAGMPPRVSSELSRQAARAAVFALQDAATSTFARSSDADIVDTMHLARRIYKPAGVPLTLGQYAALTRNFINGALSRVDDPMFQHLWDDIVDYKRALDELGVSDKYVAAHEAGSDVNNERLSKLRAGARLEVLRSVLMTPLGLFGTVTHAPIAALCVAAGRYMGVTEEGDRSVEATMRVIAGVVGLLVMYPTIGAAAWWVSGTATVGLGTVALLGASGYTAAVQQPVDTVVSAVRGRMRLLLHDNEVDSLRYRRAALQPRIRAFADDTVPNPELRGWWRDPEAFTAKIKEKQHEFEAQAEAARVVVTPESIADADLSELTIELNGPTKRHPGERAVMTYKTLPGNSRALLWIPGRNDSFFHVHVLPRFLEAGFDVYALDLRRCGRARFTVTGDEVVPELLAHDSFDFREYFEEIDASLAFLKNPRTVSTDGILQHGGCGVVYDSIVMYAHSTGGLAASLYGSDAHGGAWRGAIDGFLFNSPFWTWNLKWYEGLVVKNAYKAGVDPATPLTAGGEDSEYSVRLYRTYKFTPGLKTLKVLTATAGWCKAVTEVQKQLARGELTLRRPTLVLSTHADEVLTRDSIDVLSDMLTEGPQGKGLGNDGHERPIWSPELVEREIGTSAAEPSAHDVLAAPSKLRVEEAMQHILRWLSAHFPRVT